MVSIYKCLDYPNIILNIFKHLSDQDLDQCSLVNLQWYWAVRNSREKLILKINSDRYHIDEDSYKYINEIHIVDSRRVITNELYDNLKFHIRKLVFGGRGQWTTCKCPPSSRNNGTQSEPIMTPNDLTQLVHLRIEDTFSISSCALLDLISRSPHLKTLEFRGSILNPDHDQPFAARRFYSNLEKIYWPFPDKRQSPTLIMIAKRNDSINTIASSLHLVCQLLSAEKIPLVRFLSLYLTENWSCPNGNYKRAYTHLNNTSFLSLAKNVEALEVRTFDLELDDDEPNQSIERIFENFKLSFWKEVAKLPNLKYLAVYGAWEMERVCEELVKNTLQIEYFKCNLLPKSMIEALEAGEDEPVLSMVDGFKHLKTLTKLRAIDYFCPDKLGNIDSKTSQALRELVELLWNFEFKCKYNDNIEAFLETVYKRGNQTARSFVVNLHITPKDPRLCDILEDVQLKPQTGGKIKTRLASLAKTICAERIGANDYKSLQVWGIRQIDNWRDKDGFAQMRQTWNFYSDNFNPTNKKS